MAVYAGFQPSVSFPTSGNVGDFAGRPDYSSGRAGIVSSTGALPYIKIGTFCWMLNGNNNQQIVQLPTDTGVVSLAGFAFRSQNNIWSDASIPLGYSLEIPVGQNCAYYGSGVFFADAPSLNVGGVILYGDYIFQNNTTGALVSQTSATPASGYTLIVGWFVENPAPLSTTTPANPANRVIISSGQKAGV